MQTPDITKAQIVALLQPVLTAAVAFGAPLSEAQQAAILGLAGSISIALVIGDAIIRQGRAKLQASREELEFSKALHRGDFNPQPPTGGLYLEPETTEAMKKLLGGSE